MNDLQVKCTRCGLHSTVDPDDYHSTGGKICSECGGLLLTVGNKMNRTKRIRKSWMPL